MDPFPEESSAFDKDPAETLPSAFDLVADSIDAEAPVTEPEQQQQQQPEEPAASTMPAILMMPPASEPQSSIAPLPDLVDSSPLRDWQEKHQAELAEKSRDEAERHRKILDTAAADVEAFNAARNTRIENQRKQNKEEEELFRENQKKLYTEGTIWQQAAKVMEMAAPAKKTVKKVDAAAAGDAAPAAAAEEPQQQVPEDGKRDTSRMRQMLTSLKQ